VNGCVCASSYPPARANMLCQLRGFRLRYFFVKLTQYVDLQAYGPSASRDRRSVSGLQSVNPSKSMSDIEEFQRYGSFNDRVVGSYLFKSVKCILVEIVRRCAG
jgi:hypothetical protein